MAYADYWIKRANARMASAHAGSDETILSIRNAYDSAVGQLNRDIGRIFSRFMSENGLSAEEAKKLLNEKLPTSEIERIRRRIGLIQDEDIKSQLAAKLDSTLTRARISRLEALREDIYIQMSRMADVELRHTTARYIGVIEQEFMRNMFDSQKYLGAAFSFSRIPVNTIQEILKDDWSGKHFSKRIWENSLTNGRRIEDAVKQLLLSGTMLGTNSRKLAAQLNRLAHTGMHACERLIRTETTYFVAMADLEAARRRGTKKLRFVATLDGRTSEQCRKADGTIIDIGDAVPGKNIPPLHPFCRSVIIDETEGLVHKVRTARDPATGKNYKVPADMTYKQWEKMVTSNGNILIPDIKDPKMKRSAEAFQAMLDKNDDGSPVYKLLRKNLNEVEFKEDPGSGAAYGYIPKSDIFKFNPQHESYDRYDMDFVLAHELGHRMDVRGIRSWEDQKFLDAIAATRQNMYNDMYKWCIAVSADGKYWNDEAISDICSALSNGILVTKYGHHNSYWMEDPSNVPMEIFADLVAIKATKSPEWAERDGMLKELFDALEGMI